MNTQKLDPEQAKNYSKQALLEYIGTLEQKLEKISEERDDAELLLDTITELTTGLENQIHARNREMATYIQQVELVTQAAEAVEQGVFEPSCLAEVESRDDALGTLARVFKSMVSTLKFRETQLADAKEQLEVVLNSVPGTVSWISADGFYIGVNEHFAKTLNLSPQDFVGKRLDFLKNSPEFPILIREFITSSESFISKEFSITIEGEEYYYLMVAQKYNSGEALVVIGIDITERRKAQENLELERNSFARFVPSEYLQFLGRKEIVNIKLGDHVSRRISIMFSDIRGFTAITETMTPQEAFNFVNSYLGCVSPIIRTYNGFVMKYIGDSIMAAFPENATDAVNASIAHIDRVNEYNRGRIRAGYAPIKIGIGVHIGFIMVGIVGEDKRLQGDALSDSVNLAARLESLTKVYGGTILISDSVLKGLNHPENYHIRFLDRAIVKGRTEPIDLYEILDCEDEITIGLKLKTQKDFAKGINFYQKGKWDQAKISFLKVLSINSEDLTALLYLDRIESIRAIVDPQKWDGVWHFTRK
ncbi:MAG: PAS domain-containing protein [Spirulina sp. SIO3F2]|nr:PAS domain-containing protein [Spirulina sp. SIO3F2]